MAAAYQTLIYNNDFKRIYRRGKSYVHPHVVVYVLKNRGQGTRVGITCSKKIGKAVTRNRARRVIRAALAQVLPADVGNKDIILVARGKTAYLKSYQLVPSLCTLFQQANIPILPQEEKTE